MNLFMTFVMYMLLPLALVQSAYRIIDRKAKMTEKLVAKFPVIKEKKIIIQIFGTVGIALVIGLIFSILGIPQEVFFVTVGVIAGFVNGVAMSITYSE